MTTSNRLSKNQLSLADRIKIYEFMNTIIKKDDKGFASYVENWNDILVAKRFGCGTNAVVGIRKELFGKLKPPRHENFVPYPELINRVAALEKMVDHLMDRAGFKSKVLLNDTNRHLYTNGHSDHPTVGA